jgi:hypothetical protein
MNDINWDKATQSFGWLSTNFAIISLIFSLFAIAMSLTFIIGYFGVFDPGLVWMLEYSDITKLFFIIFSLLIILVGIVAVAPAIFFKYFYDLIERSARFFLIVVILFLLTQIVGVYVQHIVFGNDEYLIDGSTLFILFVPLWVFNCVMSILLIKGLYVRYPHFSAFFTPFLLLWIFFKHI